MSSVWRLDGIMVTTTRMTPSATAMMYPSRGLDPEAFGVLGPELCATTTAFIASRQVIANRENSTFCIRVRFIAERG